MYIRITTISYDPAKEQELLRFTDEQFIPALRQFPGFQSYTSGLDRAAARGVSVSVWDNMEHAQSIRTALGDIIGQLEALSVHFDPAQIYEVVAQA